MTEVNIAGWATCGFYQKLKTALLGLAVLYPDLRINLVEHPDRNTFREWLFSNREQYGEKAANHTSSPFVWLGNNQFIGGCDDTLSWARAFVAGKNSSNDLTAVVSESKDDGFGFGHPYDYDLIVIGGGSGGLSCAKEASKLGARVACLDFVKPSPQGSVWGLGGTCVNVGCIPKKLMHQAALFGEAIHEAHDYGWRVTNEGHNWETLRSNVQDHIKGLNFQYRVALREKNVAYLNKLGKFVDAHTLECRDKKGKVETITGARFVISVGGRPSPLECEGGQYAITSDDLFSLEKSPGKTCVIGAGYVALECAGFIKGLGFDVTVLVRSIVLRGFDRECCDKIADYMQSHGINIIRGVTPQSIVKQPDGKLLVTMSDGNSDVFDTVLCAVGRTADTFGLGLESAGVEYSKKNGKLVCHNEQTNVPHIYAIGDVLQGHPELTPVAIQAGLLLARRLFGGSTELMDYKNISTTVFTPIEYGCVGLSEDEANEKFPEEIEVYHSSFKPLEWTIVSSREPDNAFAKIIVLKQSDKVLGLHILGPNAGEITQGFGVALKKGITYQDLMATVGIHPTVAEEFTTMSITKSSGESATKGGC